MQAVWVSCDTDDVEMRDLEGESLEPQLSPFTPCPLSNPPHLGSTPAPTGLSCSLYAPQPTWVQQPLLRGLPELGHKLVVQVGVAQAHPHVLHSGQAVGVVHHDVKHLADAQLPHHLTDVEVQAGLPGFQAATAPRGVLQESGLVQGLGDLGLSVPKPSNHCWRC